MRGRAWLFSSHGRVFQRDIRIPQLGRGSGDARERVEENRSRAADVLGVQQTALIGPYQVHSARAVIVHNPWEPSDAPEADAIVTSTPNLAVSVLSADCVPILMADAGGGCCRRCACRLERGESGRHRECNRGNGDPRSTRVTYCGCDRPAISEAAYEVGPEFKAAFVAGCAENERYKRKPGPVTFISICPGYVRDMLTTLGIEYISETGVCTYRDKSILFSYRRSCRRQARLWTPNFRNSVSMMWITRQTTPDLGGFLLVTSRVWLPCLDGVCRGR